MNDKDKIKKNIAKNIVKYRVAAGLSQKEFSKKLGIGPSRVSNWENGTNSMDINMLLQICDLLGVTINDMYGIYPDANVMLSFSEQQHIKKYRDLDDHGTKMVDFTLQEEWERVTTGPPKASDNIAKMPEPDRLEPIAARNDHIAGEEELQNTKEDIANLKRPD